jgi:hypothetical protein
VCDGVVRIAPAGPDFCRTVPTCRLTTVDG